MLVQLEKGREYPRDQVLRKLVEIQYERNDYDFSRGTFRVRGDVLEIFPAYENERALPGGVFRGHGGGDQLDRPAAGQQAHERGQGSGLSRRATLSRSRTTWSGRSRRSSNELDERVTEFRRQNKPLEAERIAQRTMFDIEMMRETWATARASKIIHGTFRAGPRASRRRPCSIISRTTICSSSTRAT